MEELIIDLSIQDYNVFDVTEQPELKLKNKNFIFGKNGMGKSTLCKLIIEQCKDTHDIRTFSGFDNILEDSKLNAVVLGTENKQIQLQLKELEAELTVINNQKEKKEQFLKELEWQEIYSEQGIKKHSLLIEKEKAKSNYQDKQGEIDKFCQAKAKELKEKNSPQITKPSYNKIDFISDISNQKAIDSAEKDQLEKLLLEQPKETIKAYVLPLSDLKSIEMQTNLILQEKVEEKIIIEELKDNSEKQNFAKKGLEIHKQGENCAFCGKEISDKRIEELNSYFSVNEVKNFQQKIQDLVIVVNAELEKLEEINSLDENAFYNKFRGKVREQQKNIQEMKQVNKSFFENIIRLLDEKEKNIFTVMEKQNINIPSESEEILNNINILIDENNDFTQNIAKEQKQAQDKLRLHYVSEKLKEKESYKPNWANYEVEKNNLSNLEDRLKIANENLEKVIWDIKGEEDFPQEGTLNYLIDQINIKEREKINLLKQTKDTSKLAENINEKLKRSGKTELELLLQKENNNAEHYLIKGSNGVRPIDKVSTGEKNIIAFLYFMESLSDVENQTTKSKIIIFDDPMNSNDDTMQYLIITELHKLYQGQNYKDKFDVLKDYFLCLTHNAHFYLNVQPQGSYKDSKQKTKYDKNYFYRIENRKFNLITSEKDDINSHYAYLWIELRSLYDNNLLNSMLNSMRRIIETYVKFNKTNLINFYKNKEEHMKLFNVNSHSIDDHSAEMIGKDREKLKYMFEQLFKENDAELHFQTYWIE